MSEKNMKIVKYVTLFSLIFFVMPFVFVSCSSSSGGVSVTGVELATTITTNEKLNELKEDGNWYPNPFLIAGICLTVAAFCVLNSKKELPSVLCRRAAILEFVNALSLLIFKWSFLSFYHLDGDYTVEYKFAYWAFLIIQICVGVSCIFICNRSKNEGNQLVSVPNSIPIHIDENLSSTVLIERAFIFLEDGEWERADAYCEKALDRDPKNALGYLGKLMAELRVHKQENLQNCVESIEELENYQKAVRFAESSLRQTLAEYSNQSRYNACVLLMNQAETEKEFETVAAKLLAISGYKDADELREQCLEKADICLKDDLYNAAIALEDNLSSWASHRDMNIASLRKAIEIFQQISDWKNAKEEIAFCEQQLKEYMEM